MMGVVVRHPAVRHPMPPSLDAEAPFDAPDDWGAWMARAQAGDQQDYRRLLQAIGPYLRAIARRMLGQDEAEDAVQEILLVVHGVRHTYEPGRPFRPWLSTIATRRCIDILRRRIRSRGWNRRSAASACMRRWPGSAPGSAMRSACCTCRSCRCARRRPMGGSARAH